MSSSSSLSSPSGSVARSALQFTVLAECSTTKARAATMVLPHATVETPVFMPVGTQGTLKGLLPDQLLALDCRLILGNTYHLGNRPGVSTLKRAGGLHRFMNWPRALLTDSGGFQMVSLLDLAQITEDGVKFRSPYDESECMLTPEHSIEIQATIGADIMMQLDDVVDATHADPDRFEEARHRTVRWLDRCLKAHQRPDRQNLFPIVQGGLDVDKRKDCARRLVERDTPGFAVGGLSGGEAKDDFWRMVHVSTDELPKNKPRYLMGVGFAVDLVVCSALGIDMYDCVFPTRTARFGSALIMKHPGALNLKSRAFRLDFDPIDADCPCFTCQNHSRAYIHSIIHEPSACHLITVHNVAFQLRLMKMIRQNIVADTFPQFIQSFMAAHCPDKKYPMWANNALQAVGVHLS